MAAHHLLFFGLLVGLFHTGTCIGTTITVTPLKLELPSMSTGVVNGGVVNITCRALQGARAYYTLTIFRTLPGNDSRNKIVLLDIGSGTITGPDGVSGTVSSGRDNMSVTLVMQKAMCGDSAEYICELKYQDAEYNVVEKVDSKKLEVEAIPGNITLTPTPKGQTQFVVNETLSMNCNGPVGTVVKNETTIEWIWEYGEEVNNQVTRWTRYTDEDDITAGETTTSECSEVQNSILLRTLQTEDTNRVYRCYVRRNGKDYIQFAATQPVGMVTKDPITTPTGTGGGGGGAKKSQVGPIMGGVIGGLVVLIVIIVIVVVVLRRRNRQDDADDSNKPAEAPPAEVSYSQPNRFRNNREPQGVSNKAMDEQPAEKPSPRESHHPPRYANDFHQGHRNPGYDRDYNPDPQGPGGRGSRYSSDEDGTDNRVNTSQHSIRYGDPSFGTPI